MKHIRSGLYEHHKGGKYRVFGIAEHAERKGEKQVVYRSLSTGELWRLEPDAFGAMVEKDGHRVARFVRIGD